jgi:hypothetical protein
LQHYHAHPNEAAALLKTGNSKPANPSAELAAATILAQALLNHDAAVVKR